MDRINYPIQVLMFFCVVCFISACNNDDDEPQLTAWELEIEQVKAATDKYLDFSVAEADGLIDVSGYVPNMGHHYLNPGLVDGTFELERPEIILYVPDADGNMQMVAVEYGILPEDPNNPGNPPEGFSGDQDQSEAYVLAIKLTSENWPFPKFCWSVLRTYWSP